MISIWQRKSTAECRAHKCWPSWFVSLKMPGFTAMASRGRFLAHPGIFRAEFLVEKTESVFPREVACVFSAGPGQPCLPTARDRWPVWGRGQPRIEPGSPDVAAVARDRRARARGLDSMAAEQEGRAWVPELLGVCTKRSSYLSSQMKFHN